MIISMPVGNFDGRSVGVVCVMSSGRRLFQGAVDEGVVGGGMCLAFVGFGVRVMCMHLGPCPPKRMF